MTISKLTHSTLDPDSEAALAGAIAEFITEPPSYRTGNRFEELASDLFAYQYKYNAPYRRLCDSLDLAPGRVNCIEAIPAVPATAFKNFSLSCVPYGEIKRTFYSSGTVSGARSSHYMNRQALSLYRVSLLECYHRYFPGSQEIWALMESPDRATHSSLAYMLEALGATRYYWNDRMALVQALHARTEPVTLFGTAFAYVELLDGSRDTWHLPEGSRIIETGGFKGRTREVPRSELYRQFETRLGVSDDFCHSEYGMSEMSSQYYSTGADGRLTAPSWLRTRFMDPITDEDAAGGTPGLLRHYDLANLNSVMVIQTEDLGIRDEAGFRLMGRSTGSDLRGCSLTVEELWSKSQKQ